MTPSRALPLLSALALAGCGIEARMEARSVCVTQDAEAFPGTTAGGTLISQVSYDLGQDLPLVSEPGVDYALQVQHVAVALDSSSHLTDLGGITSLTISALPPGGSGLPEAELASYARGEDLHPTSIQAAGGEGVELRPYIAGGQLRFQIVGNGTLPTQAWTAAVTACFGMKVTLDVTDGM
ncbi:MAG: hypothetical protein QM767_09260 [Anaeromyxobacter sp.]